MRFKLSLQNQNVAIRPQVLFPPSPFSLIEDCSLASFFFFFCIVLYALTLFYKKCTPKCVTNKIASDTSVFTVLQSFLSCVGTAPQFADSSLRNHPLPTQPRFGPMVQTEPMSQSSLRLGPWFVGKRGSLLGESLVWQNERWSRWRSFLSPQE